MSDSTDANNSKVSGNTALRRIGIYALILGVVFLLGLVPMWLSARERAAERDEAHRNLRMAELQNLLGGAALDAGRGEYEMARQAASAFYERLRSEIDLRDRSAIPPARQANIEKLFFERDDTITLLARNDPASATRLKDTYFSYRQALDKG